MTKFFNLYFKKLPMTRTTDKLNFSLIDYNKVTLICTQKNTKLLLHRPNKNIKLLIEIYDMIRSNSQLA